MTQSLNLQTGCQQDKPLDYEELQAKLVDIENKRIGDLDGLDCKKCKNKGYTLGLADNNTPLMIECDCQRTRRTLDRAKASGLMQQLKSKKLDSFVTDQPFQQDMIDRVKYYLANHKESKGWFVLTGASGCGKTHLCTALTGELIKQGKSAKYMLWRDEVVELTANRMNAEVYQDKMRTLKTVDVLYIDDFLKVGGNNNVTQGELNVAWEIVNTRSLDNNLITIITSETSVIDMMGIEDSMGGRIKEMSFDVDENYMYHIDKGTGKNYRLG